MSINGKQVLRRLVSKILPVNTSYSQEGEDLILLRALDYRPHGFFVDVGAHDPIRFSNTFSFYNLGWRGLNIDPLIGLSDAFARQRARDINLPFGVSQLAGELDYFQFNEPALNTFSTEKRDSVLALQNHYKLIHQRKIPTFPLCDLLERYLPAGQEIDFLSVDAEGLDFEVLSSNNWQRYRPRFVIYEDHAAKIKQQARGEASVALTIESPSTALLTRYGYSFFAKTVSSWIFERC